MYSLGLEFIIGTYILILSLDMMVYTKNLSLSNRDLQYLIFSYVIVIENNSSLLTNHV